VARLVSIRDHLTRNSILVIVLLGGAILAVTFIGSDKAVTSLSRSIIRRVTDQTDARLGQFFEPVIKQLEMAVAWRASGLLDTEDPDAINRLLLPMMRKHPHISSLLIADTRGREHMLLRTGSTWRNRRTRREDEGRPVRWFTWTDAAPTPHERPATAEERTYDPRTRPWFRGALAKSQRVERGAAERSWTQPYRFFTTKEPGITAAIALKAQDGVTYILGFDVLLGDISRFTTSPALEVSPHGFVFVTEEESSKVIGLPRLPRFSSDEGRHAAVDKTVDEIDEPVLSAAQAAGAVGDEPVRFDAEGRTWWSGTRRFALAPDRTLGIHVVVPEEDLVGNLAALRWIILGVTLLAIALAVWRAYVLADRISDPVEALVAGSERIRKGDLEPRAPIASDLLEVRNLADSQDHMRRGLQTLMKLERDLQVARQIQQNTFPDVLPGLAGFDVEAWSEPADETGGDTFDVIGLQGAWTAASIVAAEEGAERAVLMLADATGHGIGPALSAMQLRAMLRMAMRLSGDLESIARHINEQLCEDLPGARFLTTWFGMLDTEHSTLRTFSGGQAPLMLYRAATDAVEWLQADAPPLGILPTIPIHIGEPVDLHPGDLYLVFSDGIFEAKDPDDALFGEERVETAVRAHRHDTPHAILAAVREAVDAFARGRPADDDRTAIIIKRL